MRGATLRPISAGDASKHPLQDPHDVDAFDRGLPEIVGLFRKVHGETPALGGVDIGAALTILGELPRPRLEPCQVRSPSRG